MDTKEIGFTSKASAVTKGKTGTRTTILLQDECYRHRYIRSKDDSFIVERPERLRALKLGFSAAISRIEEQKLHRMQIQEQTRAKALTVPPVKTELEIGMEVLTIPNSHLQVPGVRVDTNRAELVEPISGSNLDASAQTSTSGEPTDINSINNGAFTSSGPIMSTDEADELTKALDKLDIAAEGTATTVEVNPSIQPASSIVPMEPVLPGENALGTFNTTKPTGPSKITDVCEIFRPTVRLHQLSSHPAVRMIHAASDDGGFNNLEHLDRLAKWSRESEEKVIRGESEIPAGYLQGDLYMCPQSYSAICGAVETVCDAVDAVMNNPAGQLADDLPPTCRAFAAIRPPGHHCGEETPSGFCFVNNVAIGAAHAYLKHGVNRVIIFDIDLHHGNGTQAIAWSINAETHRKRLEQEAKQLIAEPVESSGSNSKIPKGNEKNERPGLQIFYASIHDILSYPCEDGVLELVQAASVSISGPHGQFIENIHLQPYATHEEFWEKLYTRTYSKIFDKAKGFLQDMSESRRDEHAHVDGANAGWDRNVPIFISCGFDASELEYESMSRHGRKVPVGFYYRFTRDACRFAEEFANGRVISVLEGGYSDRTLTAGGMAHLVGLVENNAEDNEDVNFNRWDDSRGVRVDGISRSRVSGTSGGPEDWWCDRNLELLEKATKKRRGRVSAGNPRASMGGTNGMEPWVERTLEIMAKIDPPMQVIPLPTYKPPPSSTAVSTANSSGKPASRGPTRAAVRSTGQSTTQRQPLPRDAREKTEKKTKLSAPSSQNSSPRKGKTTATTQKVVASATRPAIKRTASSTGTGNGNGNSQQRGAGGAIVEVSGKTAGPLSLDPNVNANIFGTDGKPEAPPSSGAPVNPHAINEIKTTNTFNTTSSSTDVSASAGQSMGSSPTPTGPSSGPPIPSGPSLPQESVPVLVKKLPRLILKVRDPGSS